MIVKEVIEKFANVPVVIHVGSRNHDLKGKHVLGWEIELDSGSSDLIVFISEAISGPTLSNLIENGKIAVTVTNPLTTMTYQFKGTYITHCNSSEKQEELVASKVNLFYSGYLAFGGYSPELIEKLNYHPTIAIQFSVTGVFNQTPGPGAGKLVTKTETV